MPTTEQIDDLQYAIQQLSRSHRGRSAMRQLLAWLDNDGLGLDGANQEAVLMLISSAWSMPGTTRDAIRDAID